MGKTVYRSEYWPMIDQFSEEDIARQIVEKANQLMSRRIGIGKRINSFNSYTSHTMEEIPDDCYVLSQDSFAPWIRQQNSVDNNTSRSKINKTTTHPLYASPNQDDHLDNNGDDTDYDEENTMTNNSTNGNIIDESWEQQESLALTIDDLIVEKMHIHYGMKGENPVNRLRFFPKTADSDTFIAQPLKEESYETLLPRVFEERALRVFCRNEEKESLAHKAFKEWCKERRSASPFPQLSEI